MGIKWLGKSHRSPVSCKEISREQVANRLQSRCKQGFIQTKKISFVETGKKAEYSIWGARNTDNIYSSVETSSRTLLHWGKQTDTSINIIISLFLRLTVACNP